MKEQIDEMYRNYLYTKLDSVFTVQEEKEEKLTSLYREQLDGKWYLVNPKGEHVNIEGYDAIGDYHEGFAWVKIKEKYNYVDIDGRLLCDEFFDGAWSFNDGYAIVQKNEKFNFINSSGMLIGKDWYERVGNYQEGFASVKKSGKWYFIDKEGRLLTKKGYYFVMDFVRGTAVVEQSNKYNLIDKSGREIFNKWMYSNEWYFHKQCTPINRNFDYATSDIDTKKYLICKTIDLKGYQVRDFFGGYRSDNGHDHFNIKYYPIKIYNTRFAICIDKETLFLFDRALGKYTTLGNIRDIEFIDKYIFDHKNDKVYFIYGKLLFDITNYYNDKVKNQDNIVVSEGVSILSKDEFFIKYEADARKKARQIRNERYLSDEERVIELKKKAETEAKSRDITKDDAIYQLTKAVRTLEDIEQRSGSIERIKVNNLFVIRGDHREINPLYLDNGLLKHIDLSGETFRFVKISGVDFRGCNLDLKPQEVFDKDLSNCNLEGIYIAPFMDFNGVDIRGTKFSQDNDPKTLDGYNTTFRHAIYDSNTTYNGISLESLYGKCYNNKEKSR